MWTEIINVIFGIKKQGNMKNKRLFKIMTGKKTSSVDVENMKSLSTNSKL